MTDRRKPRVVIVGAGMAGLAAAARLTEAGTFDVVVMEATPRPGGRIHTSWQMGEELIELGAQWIHGEGTNPLYLFAKENGQLKSQDPKPQTSSSDRSANSGVTPESNDSAGTWVVWPMKNEMYILEDGTVVPDAIVNRVLLWFDHLATASKDVSTHRGFTTTGEYLSSELERFILDEVDGEAERRLHRLVGRWCLRVECVDCACQSVHDLSLARYNDFNYFPGVFYCCLGRNGFRGIVDVLLEKLPESTVRYCSPVTRIDWESSSTSREPQVVVHATGHQLEESLTADHVIVTASLGYLKEHHLGLFQPPLPLDLQQAIGTISFGTVDKIFLKFGEPFWDGLSEKDVKCIQLLWEADAWHDPPATGATGDGQDSPDDVYGKIMRRITGFEAVDGHDDVLCGWISGKEAECMEHLPDSEVEKICVDTLSKFLKRDIPKPIQIEVSRWHSNPFVRGSYTSSLPVHGTGEEFNTMARPVYSERRTAEGSMTQIPTLLFAGEACTKRYHSTVHGAMVTGQQQAERLIQFYRAETEPGKGVP